MAVYSADEGQITDMRWGVIRTPWITHNGVRVFNCVLPPGDNADDDRTHWNLPYRCFVRRNHAVSNCPGRPEGIDTSRNHWNHFDSSSGLRPFFHPI